MVEMLRLVKALPVRVAALCMLVLAIVVFFIQWYSLGDFYNSTAPGRFHSRPDSPPYQIGHGHDTDGESQHDFSAGNSTLGVCISTLALVK